jgi:hypothetical protein
MDTALDATAGPEMATRWSRAPAVRPARHIQWDLLSAQDRLSVAYAATGGRQVEYGLGLFQALARAGGMGEADGGPGAG